MQSETIALETLRQKIEAVLQQSGSLADYLDRGRPDAASGQRAHRQIAELEALAASWKRDLEQLCSRYPEAVAPWVDLHVHALRCIAAEPARSAVANTRRRLAVETMQEWERVRSGQQTYVGTNGYFLADHQEAMRRLFFVLPC